MRKRSLAMLVVAAMAVPAQALATLCFTDNYGGAWALEVGQQQGVSLPIFGFRQNTDGCLDNANGVQPLTGEVSVVASDTAVFGVNVNNDEDSEGCASFRATFIVDINTGQLSGEYSNDYGDRGSVDLSFSASCPNPFELPTAVTKSGAVPGRRGN